MVEDSSLEDEVQGEAVEQAVGEEEEEEEEHMILAEVQL